MPSKKQLKTSQSTLKLHPAPRPIRTVGFVIKRKHPEAGKLFREISRWLAERGIHVCSDRKLKLSGAVTCSTEQIPKKADLLIVLGGDGTLVYAVGLVGDREIPILGINMGTVGFLTHVTVEETYEALERMLAGETLCSRRSMLEVSLWRGRKKLVRRRVLNDVVINKGALARIMTLRTYIDGLYLNDYRGDGLIISTPTGSTAYSLSSGGPVVHPRLPSVLLSPICPFGFGDRPIVTSDTALIQVDLINANGKVYLTMDGQVGELMKESDRLEVRKADKEVLLVESPHRNYFELLRTKLHWGSNSS